jgi:endonuclease/exonuclease/phosphatase family metal-dependent hydrolase
MAVVPQMIPCRTDIVRLQPDATYGSGDITWVGPATGRDRTLLDAWCQTVGPPIVASRSLDMPPAADRVAIVSWNTHVGAGDVVELVGRLRGGRLTGGIPVPTFILLLQEAYRRGDSVPQLRESGLRLPSSLSGSMARMTIEEIADRLELNLFYVPSMRNGAAEEDRGNAILTTLPFDDPLIIELPFERQRRVAIAARVRGRTSAGTPWQLRAVTTHLDTSPALTRGGPAQARLRQARALVDALRAGDEPLILGADLNTWWGTDEPAFKTLRAEFPDANASSARGPTWRGPAGVNTRVDYLFARLGGSRVEVRRLDDRLGSDHHPLVTVIDLK